MISMLMRLGHVDWYLLFLDAIAIEYQAPIIAQVLEEERRRLLDHPAFSSLTVPVRPMEETEEDDSGR